MPWLLQPGSASAYGDGVLSPQTMQDEIQSPAKNWLRLARRKTSQHLLLPGSFEVDEPFSTLSLITVYLNDTAMINNRMQAFGQLKQTLQPKTGFLGGRWGLVLAAEAPREALRRAHFKAN